MAGEQQSGADVVLTADVSRWESALNKAKAATADWATRTAERFKAAGEAAKGSLDRIGPALSKVGAGAVDLGKQFGAATLGAVGLAGGLAGLTTIGAGLFAEWLTQSKELAAQLERGAKLADQYREALARVRAESLARAAGTDETFTRINRLNVSFEEAQKSAEGLSEQINRAEKRLDELKETGNQAGQLLPRFFGGDKRNYYGAIEEAEKNLERLRDQLHDTQKARDAADAAREAERTASARNEEARQARIIRGVVDLNRELDLQVRLWGKTADEATLAKLEMQGLTENQLAWTRELLGHRKRLEDEQKVAEMQVQKWQRQQDAYANAVDQLRERDREQGKQVTESARTADQQRAEKIKDLQRLKDQGDITDEVFAKARRNLFERAERPDAAIDGSKEALKLLIAHESRQAREGPQERTAKAAEEAKDDGKKRTEMLRKVHEEAERSRKIFETIGTV